MLHEVVSYDKACMVWYWCAKLYCVVLCCALKAAPLLMKMWHKTSFARLCCYSSLHTLITLLQQQKQVGLLECKLTDVQFALSLSLCTSGGLPSLCIMW